jgi:glycosyl transferase family 9 (putative heptosyltransferase)
MKKLCVCTLTSGDFYNKLARTSHETFKDYAEKCGADFRVQHELTTEIPGYSKLALIYDLLKQYERVLFVDTDTLIRFDAPDLFKLYGPEVFVAFDEHPLFPERAGAKRAFADTLGLKDGTEWIDNGRYYNTGVMLVSHKHRPLFVETEHEIDSFGEQTLLNFRLYKYETEITALPHRFNRLIKTLLVTGEPLDDSYIVHFAGAFSGESSIEDNYTAWVSLGNRFLKYKAEGTVPELPRRIFLECSGALGDTVSVEPVVRYLREVMEPQADISIKTLWPEVFAHLALHPRTRILGPGDTAEDKGHLRLNLFPKPAIANFNMVHAVDYAALALFRGQLPRAHKGIKLAVNSEDPFGVENMVLIHPGKTWQSKTFPVAWWQAVIDGIRVHAPVALIGRTYPEDDLRGTVDVDAKRCLDLRNKTTLGQLFAVIQNGRILVSNDSSPVHIAGAFKTPTIMISTAKHPDFIWPHRDPSLNISLGYSIKAGFPQIGVVNTVFMNVCTEEELANALPTPGEVVDAVLLNYEKKKMRAAIPYREEFHGRSNHA